MAVKTVLKIGNPMLQQIAQNVTSIDQKLKQTVIQDMLDTMEAENGAGIAAPQIGIGLRIVIFGIDRNPRYPDAEAVPTTVLINPVIEIVDQEKEEGWEGCLSVPDYRGLVPRYKMIRYSGFSENGKPIEKEVSGFHACVVQHEVDHLDGILYPQRIRDLRNYGLTDELEAAGTLPRIKNEAN